MVDKSDFAAAFVAVDIAARVVDMHVQRFAKLHLANGYNHVVVRHVGPVASDVARYVARYVARDVVCDHVLLEAL